jgi:uncharacterized Zn finger protein
MELTDEFKPHHSRGSAVESVAKPGLKMCESCGSMTNDSIQLSGNGATIATCGNCGVPRKISVFEVNGQSKKLAIEKIPAKMTGSTTLDSLEKEEAELSHHIENVSVYRAKLKVIRKAIKILRSINGAV